jgi:predicted nucleotidyltransferase
MKKPDELPVKVRDYVDAVIQFAEARSPDIVSVSAFGSVAKGGFSQSVSDVDLIVALADRVPQKIKRIVSSELAALELKHRLRDRPQTTREFVYSKFDRMAGQFKSYFVCYKGDLLSGNTAAVFEVNPLAESLLLSTHIGFANIVTSAKVVWGEDFLHKIHIPALTKGHLAKNCASFLLLNACALLGYPVLPNATKYSMSVLKWMLHNCYFCYTLKSATVEEEIDFFRTKLGECKVFSELLSLRQKYQSSCGFMKGCFRMLIQLYVVTVSENQFPITVEVK